MEINDGGTHGSTGLNEPIGGTVKPVYSERSMKCITVTESELRHIGLANLGVTVSVGIGSALIAFGLDILKDSLILDDVPVSAQVLTSYIQPLCLGLGAIFYLVAGVLWWWRKDMVALIKRESGLA